MRILVVTNMYPAAHAPHSGVFVEQQVESLRQIGLNVDVLFVDRLVEGIRTYIDLTPQVRDRIKQFRPDVIHAMYGGVMAARVVAAADDIPSIVTFHGSDLLGEHLSGTFRRVMAQYGVMCSIKAARRATRIVVVSRHLARALPADVERSKVRLIPCGIDLERFMPLDREFCRKSLGWDETRFHILFSGSANPVKRPRLARAAVDSLKNFSIDAEIHFLRGVANNQVPFWLNASDVVLVTSLHEGSPTIVKEALACNVPVVSVNVGDVVERIQDIDGCYIASPEPNDIAAKLACVYDGPSRVASRSRMRALSLERIANHLRDTYLESAAMQLVTGAV